MKEEWLLRGAVVPVDAETTAVLVAEIKRLIDVVGDMALKETALQDSEQYRMQMAGICTAAIGYWTEYDSISPDYDTVALRDVAKLYAKYDALYKAQNVSHGMIAGALFDFMAWLTSRPKRIMLSSADDASPAVDAIKDFAKMRGLSLDKAQVQTWQEALAQPQQEPVAWVILDRWKTGKEWPDDCFSALPIDGWTPLYTSPQPAQPQQEPPFSVQQACAMAQVCLDLHEALGCKWGDNPYLAIACLREAQPAQPQQEIDWKDMYEKQKRRAEMWIAKYEADIGLLEKAAPVMAQPQQEPVAEIVDYGGYAHVYWKSGPKHPVGTKFYTSPPERTWVGLTDQEVMDIAFNFDVPSLVVRTAEAKLKEKNK